MYCELLVLSGAETRKPHEDRPVLYETASRLTKELTGGIKIEQRCVGSDLPLAGGKAKIPERYQEQMCGCIETLTDAIHNGFVIELIYWDGILT